MTLAEIRLHGWLFFIVLLFSIPAHASHETPYDAETEVVWKSDRLAANWFGGRYRVRLGGDGIPADWIEVKAGRRSNIEVSEIVVRYLSRHGHHPRKQKFYPYQRVHGGERVRFKLPRTHHVLGIAVVASGISGSHKQDRFRILLSKNVRRPPEDFVQTGYFYGECIGGHKCPGYRRHPIQRFSIDLEDDVKILKIQFDAHDAIGRRHGAKVNVYVDDLLVAQGIDIKRRRSSVVIDLKPTIGRVLTFEAASNDEAMIERIAVEYSAYRDRKQRRRGGGPGRFERGFERERDRHRHRH